MSDPRIAVEFLKAHLPKKICELIDFSTVSIENSSYINYQNNRFENDILLNAKIKHIKSYLYLLNEHQSTSPKWMALRVFHYLPAILMELKKVYKLKTLPIVYPLIFYNGKSAFSAELDFFSLFGEFRDIMREVWCSPIQLIQASHLSDEIIKQRPWSGVMEYTMKHIHDPEIKPHIEAVLPNLQMIRKSKDELITNNYLKYLMCRGQSLELSDLNEYIVNGILWEDSKMVATTIADRYFENGVQQGMEQGMERGLNQGKKEIAKQLLSEGIDIVLIKRVTGLGKAEIKEIQTDYID